MKKTVSINWKENMAFEATIDSHKIMMDAPEAAGGENKGSTPKPFLLVSLGGCTAMDVISLARKMKQEITDFEVELIGEIEDEFPKPFTSVHMIYRFWGKDLIRKRLEKAVNLSQDRYCGVSATLRKAMGITHEIVIM